MQVVIFNGSPRRKKSNTKLLINSFLSGYKKVIDTKVPVYYIASLNKKEELLYAYKNAKTVIIFFPLYTDMMPGIVKEFFEDISKIKNSERKKIAFVVQSGFPEAYQSIFVEKYLEKLAKRLKLDYIGTIIKGGVEGIKLMPSWMTKELFTNFSSLGEYFAKNNEFDEEINSKLRKPYKMSKIKRNLFSIISKTGLTNFYWNGNLKRNKAYEKRHNHPYAQKWSH